MKCQPGFNYNALTTSCNKRKNKIRSFIKKVFLNNLGVEIVETTIKKVDTSTFNLLQFANRLKLVSLFII